jgi:NADPH:quinone reductase-like Zn-dependent oxidoreductase
LPAASSLELEYAVRDDVVHILRVIQDTAENARVSTIPAPTEDITFFAQDRRIRLGVGTPGLLDSLVFVDDSTATGPLPDDYVQIRPAAFGLNFRDVMVAMGQLDETRMGFECSGYVAAVGPGARARGLEVGDRVYAFLRGYFANTIRVHHTSVAKVPEGMDLETAASVPLVFITAYHALHNMARLRNGERVLIHSGTGGVGQAAIMLAQLAKAEVFVTVGSKEKREFLTSTYGIDENQILNSRNASFARDIMEATGGRGVDVVLNSLAGPLLSATWNCIAPFGRFIEIGKRDLELNNSLEMGPFVRSVSFASLDLITLGELRGDIVADIFVQVNALLRVGCIKPVTPIAKFAISEAETAFRTMQAGRHMGKIVLVPSEDALVEVSAGQSLCVPQTPSNLAIGR